MLKVCVCQSHANTQRNFSSIHMCILFWLICCTPFWTVSVCVLWRYTETIHKLPVMSKVMCFILLEVLISTFYAVASRGISTNERNDSPGCWVISGCPAVLWYSAIFFETGICNGNLLEIHWNVLGKFYFVRGNFVQKRYQSTWSFKIFQYAIYYQFLIK